MPERSIPRAAIIATHNRPTELRRCVELIAPQVDLVVVVDNASEPAVTEESVGGPSPHLLVTREEEQPPNLSRLWNVGLDCVRWWLPDRPGVRWNGQDPRWNVAVLNDDAVPPPGWFDAVEAAMEATGAPAGCNDPFDRMGVGQCALHGPDAPPGVLNRLAGWAMVLRGEWAGARFDEDMRWNFSDDDISYRARLAGGLVYVGGFQVQNEFADQSTRGVLAEQAGRDRAVFVAKHGRQPW